MSWACCTLGIRSWISRNRQPAIATGNRFDPAALLLLMGKRALRRIQPFLLFFFALVSPALAQSNFFENKTIKLVLGFSPGGISDLWGRALARAMSQTLPGRPNIILQNMPGAGSMTAANYIYSVAKPDGLTIGFVTPGLYFNQLTEMREVQFDWAKFAWIGSPERTVRIMYGRADTPYKTLEDIRNARRSAALRRHGARHRWALFPAFDRSRSRREIQYRDRLSRRGGNRSGDAEKRSALPSRQPGRLLRQRAHTRLGQERLFACARARQRQARPAFAGGAHRQ